MSWGKSKTTTAPTAGTKTVTIKCGPCRLSAEVDAKQADYFRSEHARIHHGGGLWGGR